MWIVKLTTYLAGLYVVIVVIAYALQTRLIFPAGLVADTVALPADARHHQIETADNEQIVVVRIPPTHASSKPLPLLLGFGGNAWNADAVALMLHREFPDHEIAALHYRGYKPSSGSPSAKAIMDDALLAYDSISGVVDHGVVAIGFSLGASVAVELAASRPVRGAVLVTPFDSLKELAASHYSWLPVRWLLRHKMEAAATLRNLDLPVAVITAENDNVVPRSRSAPVREAAKNLRADFNIKATGHNDIYNQPEFLTSFRHAVNAVTED